jgi:hypothetical protein
VQIRVALRSGAHTLLQVSVSAAGKQRLYLVDPQGGVLTVKAEGGPGGSGGRAAAVAEGAPEVSAHPTETVEATAPVDEMVLTARRGAAEASPLRAIRKPNPS